MLKRHTIGTRWSILVDSEFTRDIDQGDVVLWTPGRTIHASVFNTHNAEAEEAIEKMIEGRPGIPVQMFDREEPGLAGHAYLLPETRKSRKYWGLNTWTAAKGEVACVTIYFDDLHDLNWAIGVWKSVRPREGQAILN
ncbi:MAG TPA: hypothetical protein VLJ39_21070 [Tepidisphaeraceae bacterium]|nr:hypothetical protein [Tepidisphaeraceae bacterium]